MKTSSLFAVGPGRPALHRSVRRGTNPAIVIVLLVVACLFGAVAALIGGIPAVFLLTVLLSLAITLRDYRAGVVALTFLLPWATSPLLPHGAGLSVANIVALLATLSFGIHVILHRKPTANMPRIFFWCLIVPSSIGVLVALTHLGEAGISMGSEVVGQYDPIRYVKGRYFDSLIYVLYAYLLANAVRESNRPDRWLAAFCASALLPVVAVFGLIALYRVGLSDLQAHRGFMEPLGFHANSMAWMLVTLIGPLLYMTASARGWTRIVLLVPTFGVAVALLLTFSRGGFLGLMVVLAMFAINRKRVSVLILVVTLVAVSLFAIPAVRERLLTGVEAGALSEATSMSTTHGDALTAGRLAFWPILAREVKRSPIWGRGIGSTAWSDAVRRGIYTAIHPHNLFLLIAMDLGLVGFGLVLYLYYRVGGTFARLARASSLSALTRAFFAGALASFVGSMAVGATTAGFYMPEPEHTFYWFAVGMAVAWWRVGQVEPADAHAPGRRWTFGIRPMPQRQPLAGNTFVR